MPAVDILYPELFAKKQYVMMRPLATINVAACFGFM